MRNFLNRFKYPHNVCLMGRLMPKVSARQIELDEKRVIRELQKDSNQSIDSIAKRCGFSRQKVWRMIKKLEKSKIIWGYHAVVDNEKLLLKKYIMLIKKTNVSMAKLVDVIISRQIEQSAEDLGVMIDSSTYLHGAYDWQLTFTAGDIKQAKRFCETFIRLYQTYVADLILLEEIFPVNECNIQNPNIKKLKEFV